MSTQAAQQVVAGGDGVGEVTIEQLALGQADFRLGREEHRAHALKFIQGGLEQPPSQGDVASPRRQATEVGGGERHTDPIAGRQPGCPGETERPAGSLEITLVGQDFGDVVFFRGRAYYVTTALAGAYRLAS